MPPALNRVLFNVLCKDLPTSVAFYRRIVSFETIHESDWFVVLTPPGQPNVQLGLIDQISEFTPRHAWGMHQGSYLTLVVDDVFAALEAARAVEADILEEPVALDYGQTRMLIRDPNGMILDLSTPTAELAAREDVEIVPAAKPVAIDQAQPEEGER